MARPKKEIDEDMIRRLAAIHCTVEEIATIAGCSKDTLERRFSEAIRDGRLEGKTSLRRHQWEAAQKGNITMLIWLGKQLLNQRDRPAEDDFSQPMLPPQLTPEQFEEYVTRMIAARRAEKK